MKYIRPLVLIADIAFTENRFPLRRAAAAVESGKVAGGDCAGTGAFAITQARRLE